MLVPGCAASSVHWTLDGAPTRVTSSVGSPAAPDLSAHPPLTPKVGSARSTSVAAASNAKHEIEVELEVHELAAVRRIRYLDDIMNEVLDSACPSDVEDLVVLTGSRFAFEHLVGEIAHAINTSRGRSARLEALDGAAEAIESELARS